MGINAYDDAASFNSRGERPMSKSASVKDGLMAKIDERPRTAAVKVSLSGQRRFLKSANKLRNSASQLNTIDGYSSYKGDYHGMTYKEVALNYSRSSQP